MSSLTNAIGITTALVKDIKVRRKMAIPLDCGKEVLLRRLNCCFTSLQFDQWHWQQVVWIRHDAQNQNLERLCEEVASVLRPAIMKARLLRYYASHNKPLPSHFLSDRDVVVSALNDILLAFNAFRAVNEDPDLDADAVHIRAMILVYLRRTFELMFLLGKVLSPWSFYSQWEACLAESRFEDFRFDRDDEYPGMYRPHLQNTGLQGVLPDPAQVPATYLPYHPTSPILVRNPGPYGAEILRNNFDSQ